MAYPLAGGREVGGIRFNSIPSTHLISWALILSWGKSRSENMIVKPQEVCTRSSFLFGVRVKALAHSCHLGSQRLL